jgi:alkylation response protein AidB-like acyl-CoA dehydrogenase
MNLSLSADQVMLQDSVAKLLAEHSTGARIRQAESTGLDEQLWTLVCEMGIPGLRVDEAHGGSGMGLHEALVVAEQAGRFLASAPVVESMVTHRLVSACASGAELTARSRKGDASAQAVLTLALHDIGAMPVQIVPWGHAADLVICKEGDRLLAVSAPAGASAQAPASLGGMAVREIDFQGLERTVLMEGKGAAEAFGAAIEEWKLLTAAVIAAGAQRALELAAEYAREREAFGKPIGTFQGLAHPLADSAVDVDGARLLCWRTVDMLARRDAGAAARIPMALWWAADSAGRALTRAIRTFGGYGMSLEYDAQLYFRRINALAVVAGDPDLHLEDVAQRLSQPGAQTPLPDAGETPMTFEWDEQCAQVMARMRAFCEPRDDAAMQRFYQESDDWHQPELYREMAKTGLLYPDWPTEYGGGGLRPIEAAAIEQVLGEHGWYLLPRITTNMVGKMILHFGSDAAKREILPKLASGDACASLGYSEPSGGSDVFAARTRATPDGDEWVINGQKMFTSQGHIADYCLLIARTAADKYRGVTLFIVPLHQPGYAFDEIKTIGDERTNVTFYENMRVPDIYRLGEVNGGVKVLAAALTMEQSGEVYRASLFALLRAAREWARTPRAGRTPGNDANVRCGVAELAVKAEVQDVLTRRTTWAAAHGRLEKSHGPMAKLFGTEALVDMSARLVRLSAPWSLMRGGGALGVIEREFRRSIPATIYAGTSEIQRSLIAETALGLPRSR